MPQRERVSNFTGRAVPRIEIGVGRAAGGPKDTEAVKYRSIGGDSGPGAGSMREIRGCVGLEQLPARGQVEQDGPAGWENMNFLVDCLRTTERAVASGPRPRCSQVKQSRSPNNWVARAFFFLLLRKHSVHNLVPSLRLATDKKQVSLLVALGVISCTSC